MRISEWSITNYHLTTYEHLSASGGSFLLSLASCVSSLAFSTFVGEALHLSGEHYKITLFCKTKPIYEKVK